MESFLLCDATREQGNAETSNPNAAVSSLLEYTVVVSRPLDRTVGSEFQVVYANFRTEISIYPK